MSAIKIDILAGEVIEGLTKELTDLIPKAQRKIAREVIPVTERYADRLVAQKLGVEAPARNQNVRFVWSNDPTVGSDGLTKQQRAARWFFANYPNGYTRTGKLRKNWQAVIDFDARSGVTSIEVSNDARGASYVYGAEEFDYKQVPGHATTGWLNAGDVGADVIADIGIFYEKELFTAVEELIEEL